MSDEFQTRRDIDRLYDDVYETQNGNVRFVAFKENSEYREKYTDIENRSDIGTIDAIIDSYNLTYKADTNHKHTKSDVTDFSHTHTSSDVTDLLDVIYPVGHIYMSITNSHPNVGTWVQIKDTFLLACGDTYSNGATGGEASHTLTESEMPSHSHRLNGWEVIISQNGNTGNAGLSSGTLVHPERQDSQARYTQTTGSGQAHNNMPPYMAVYVFKRTE